MSLRTAAGATANPSHHRPIIDTRMNNDKTVSWGDVESPCMGTCKLDSSGTFCIGCLRTRGEIAVWSTASNEEKRTILAAVAERQKHV